MRPSISVLFLSVLCLPGAAEITPEITINLYDHSGILPGDLAAVERSAGDSLRRAGIDVRWRNCPNPDCGEDETQFVVAVLPERMAQKIAQNSKQCGLAATSGKGGFPTHAYVFHDRVVGLAKSEMAPWTLLLGVTIAHEVGHLLLGDNSHFSVGIMRAGWRAVEIKQALMGILTFTPEQATRMREDAVRRAGRPL